MAVFYLFTNQPFVLRQSNITPSNGNQDIAGFGQATFSATDRLRFMSAAERHDKRDAAGLAPDRWERCLDLQ